MIKAVLFDMDGVILDSHDAWFYIFNKTLMKFEKKEISLEEFDECVWAKAFEKTCKKYFTVSQSDINQYYLEIYPEFKQRTKPMKNVEETLTKLRGKGIKLAVASNTQKEVVKKSLVDVNLAGFFDLFLGGDSVEKGKPEPDILFKALELLRLNKEDVLFIGDTIWDKMAAEAAGVEFVGFQIDSKNRIEDLNELIELV